MRGINSIFIAFLVFSLVMVSLYVVSEFNVGTKIQFAVKPGALYVVQSYQLYDENGKPITKAYPGQTVKMKVCVKPTSSSVTSYLYREVFVEGGIIPNKWYEAGTYSIIGTVKNPLEFATLTSNKCCPGNEFYGSSVITYTTDDIINQRVKCTEIVFKVPSENSYDHCHSLGSAWQDYGNNYHYGVTLFNGYCYPSPDEQVYDVEWYKTFTIEQHQTTPTPQPPTTPTPPQQPTQPQVKGNLIIEQVSISSLSGSPGQEIPVSVSIYNNYSEQKTICVESGIAPKTWKTFAILPFTQIYSDVRLDQCCPQNEFYSSECKVLQPGEEYTFKVYPHVPTEQSYDHCNGHGSAWAGYGSNYVIGYSILNDKCYPDENEIVYKTDWSFTFTVVNQTVNETNQTGYTSSTHEIVHGEPVSSVTTGEYILYGLIGIGIASMIFVPLINRRFKR